MAPYENVTFGKSEGSLVVSSKGLSFVTGEKALKVPWSSIAKHQINPKSQAKALLKVMLADNKSSAKLFQMANREDLERINTEIISNTTKSKKSTPPRRAASSRATASGKRLYQSVICKNMEGTLHLLENELKFESKEDTKKTFSIPWSSINKQQMSPAKVSKCMLKLTKKDEKVVTFQVSSRQDLEALNTDIETRRKKGSSSQKTAASPTKKLAATSPSKPSRTETANGDIQYSQISFKSANGSLTLSTEQMQFQSTGPKKLSKIIRWSRVDKCQGNPPSHAKVMLKIMLIDDSPLVLQLTDRKVLQQLKDDITERLNMQTSPKKANGESNNKPKHGLGGQLGALTGSETGGEDDDAVTVETAFNSPAQQESSSIVYEGVKQDSNVGRLTLTKENISFQKDGAAAATATYPWKDIFKHQCSPPKIAKAILKLILSDSEKAITFQLSSRKELDQIKKQIAIRLQESAENSTENEPKVSKATSSSLTLQPPVQTTAEQEEEEEDSGLPHFHAEASGVDSQSAETVQKTSTDQAATDSNAAKPSMLGLVLADDTEEEDTVSSLLAAPAPENRKERGAPRTKSGIISDLLALASDSDDEDVEPVQTTRSKSDVISDLLAVASVGSGSSSEASEKTPTNTTISGLLALSELPREVTNTQSAADVMSIFDESFASLMSDTGFGGFDDNSDDDFSVATHNTTASEQPQKMTELPQQYDEVTFRSTKGVVTLDREHFVFQPDEAEHPGEPPTKIEWDSVERHHGAPPKKQKAMLKIFFKSGKSTTFTLANRKDLELIRMDMTTRLHDHRNTSFTSKALEGLVIGKGVHSAARSNGLSPSYQKTPTGAKTSSAYHPVHFQQAEGSLFLSWDQLSFQPSGLGDIDNATSIFWDAVAGHELSGEKPVLNVNLTDGSLLSFRFANRKEMGKCADDADDRMRAYDEFERVSKTENGSTDAGKMEKLSPSKPKKVITASSLSQSEMDPEDNISSLLNLSASSIDDLDDEDLFATPPPPPPPPRERANSDTSDSDNSNASGSSSSSSNSSSSSSSGGSQNSDTEQPDDTEHTEVSVDESQVEATEAGE